MKGLFLLWLSLGLGVQTLLAQGNRYDIALSGGFYQAPKYTHATNRPFLAADFDYHIWKRWTISTGFLNGQFAYFEDWRSDTFDYQDYTNAKGYESHVYFTGSYSAIQKKKFLLQAGFGIGIFTQRLKYTYREPSSGGSPRGNGSPEGNGSDTFIAEESFSIAEIPLKIESIYKLGTRIGLGVKMGTYIQFNRPLAGTYIGPQMRVSL